MTKLEKLVKENQYLKEKIIYYEGLLKKYDIDVNQESIENSLFSASDKLSIYLNYFKGRNDCYAVRWETKDKSGYAPAYTDKAKYLKKEQRKDMSLAELYKPFNEDALILHLKGLQTIGIYPMLSNNTCYFLALDFDEKNWKSDTIKFSEICVELNIDHLIEISRSGNGAHVWIFFEDALNAKDARRLGRYLLTKAMMSKGLDSFKSYDRMFPTQDYIEKDGIGNLIALPLNGKSGAQNYTLFVDRKFVPYRNQYQKLKETKKLSQEEISRLLTNISKENELGVFSEATTKIKLDSSDFNHTIKLEINSQISIKKSETSNKGLQILKRLSSIINPEFYKKQSMRVSTYGIPRIIELYEEENDNIKIPLGLLKQLKKLFEESKILYEVNDKRVLSKMNVKPQFIGELKNDQNLLLNEIFSNERGVVVAPTGFGKTILGISLMVKLKTKALIIVNRKNLAEQWIDKINKFSTIKNIGKLYDKENTLGKDVDIALVQSLSKYENIEDIINSYGLIIVDEAHHLASVSYERLIRRFNAKYVIGLTATLKRYDGLENIVTTMLGPVIKEVKIDSKNINKVLESKLTSFKLDSNNDLTIHDAYQKLCDNEERNQMIIEDIKKSILENKNILVLTDRINHLSKLETELMKVSNNLLVVHGRLKNKEKELFTERLKKQNNGFVILSTGKYIGEGFDDDRLDTLFLTMPFKWKGTLQQYVGRLNRLREQKNEIHVYDYGDIQVRYFSLMYLERLKGYKKMGFNINESSKTPSYIYDVKNYEEKLKVDLENAKEVSFIIKYKNESRLKELIEVSNVEPIVSESARSISNIIIIDNKYIWYGSVNPFTFRQTKDADIMRYEDILLAKNLLLACD